MQTLENILASIKSTFEVEFEPLQVDGSTLEVLSIKNMQNHLDGLLKRKAIHDPLKDLPLWAKIWPGSFVLGRLLRKYEPMGKSLLEIGAGCGILSIIAVQHGFSRIVVSDVNDDALLFARANILHNSLENKMEVRRVDVKAPVTSCGINETFDIMAASEILYLDDLHRPLLKFVDRFLAPHGKALFCTDIARLKPRFAKLAAQNFKVSQGHIGVKSEDAGLEQRRVYNITILERP